MSCKVQTEQTYACQGEILQRKHSSGSSAYKIAVLVVANTLCVSSSKNSCNTKFKDFFIVANRSMEQ